MLYSNARVVYPTIFIQVLNAQCTNVSTIIFNNMRWIFKRGAKIIFSCLFLLYSMISLETWIRGDVAYNLINRRQPNIMFPSVTLCPSQDKNPLMNIKIGLLRAEYKLQDRDIEGFSILPTFLRPKFNFSRILDKYSYFRNESIAYDGQFM